MPLPHIPLDDFRLRCHHLWDSRWLLLCAGDLAGEHDNLMTVAAPGFAAAELNDSYPARDYHRIYYGEITAVRGVEEYRAV